MDPGRRFFLRGGLRNPPPAGADRLRRPQPARTAPDRSGTTARATAAAQAAAAPAPTADLTGPATPLLKPEQATIDEAVATSVKTAYDVLAESIEQGRRSAEQFRHGDYNMRDVPGDVRQLAANLLRLARQFSTTAFEVCDALLAQQGPVGGPPPPGTTPVPPFRDDAGPAPSSAPSPSPSPSPASSAPQPAPASALMRLGVEFSGAVGASAHTASLARPLRPVRPDQISAAPLLPRGGGAGLTQVSFAADLVNGGLLATITVPHGQAPGIYSGAVYAPGQDLPLGLLIVELPAASAPHADA